jgi:hypothetical protein
MNSHPVDLYGQVRGTGVYPNAPSSDPQVFTYYPTSVDEIFIAKNGMVESHFRVTWCSSYETVVHFGLSGTWGWCRYAAQSKVEINISPKSILIITEVCPNV